MGVVGSATVRHCLTVVVLCLLTIFALLAPWRFQIQAPLVALGAAKDVGPPWIVNDDGRSPRTVLDGEQIVLDASGAATPYITTVMRNLPTVSHVKISIDLKIDGLRPGQAPWQQVEVVVVSFDRESRPIRHWPMKVVSIDRDEGWRLRAETFPVHPQSAAFRLLVYNGAVAGTASIRRIGVAPLEERSGFAVLRGLVLLLWAAYLLHLVGVVARLDGNAPAKALLLALATATALAVLMPQPYYGHVVTLVEQIAHVVRYGPPTVPVAGAERPDAAGTNSRSDRKATDNRPSPNPGGERPAAEADSTPDASAPGSPDRWRPAVGLQDDPVDRFLDGLTVKQVGHFSMFLLLAITALNAFPRFPMTRIVTLMILAAGATEVLQLFLATRTSSLSDFSLNLGGLIIGSLLFSVARWGCRAAGRPS